MEQINVVILVAFRCSQLFSTTNIFVEAEMTDRIGNRYAPKRERELEPYKSYLSSLPVGLGAAEHQVVRHDERTFEHQLSDHLDEGLEGVTQQVAGEVGLDQPRLTLGEVTVDLELDHHVEAVAVDADLAGQQHGASETVVGGAEGVQQHVEDGYELAVAGVLDEALEARCHGQQSVAVGGVTVDAVADLNGAVAAERLDAVGVGHSLAGFLLNSGGDAVGRSRCIYS